jgi:hypothetical protein
MNVPDWVGNVVSGFEARTDPHREAEISDALSAVRKDHGDLLDEDWKGFLAEHSAFLFIDRRRGDSVWGTYFAPMMSGKKHDDTDFFAPDIRDLNGETVHHWEQRSTTCKNTVMRARYADLSWDLKFVVVGEKPNPDYARTAIDSYVEAVNKKLYPMEIVGIQWLGRALDLSRSINDAARTKRIADVMFEFYDKVAQPQFMGTWIFLLDDLYGEKFITPEQEQRIIVNMEAMLARTSDATASRYWRACESRPMGC